MRRHLNRAGLKDQWLVALDGTQYHASNAMHCPNCLRRQTSNGPTLYYHSAITPVIVCPGRSEVIALPPAYIMPQDGHDKQDCERGAGKRGMDKHAKHVASKTKGYHLEHHFGHGTKYLSAFLLSLNLIALLFPTVMQWRDDKYALLRQVLARRQTFFDDVRALTRYMVFESWPHLMDFMIRGLELESTLDPKLDTG